MNKPGLTDKEVINNRKEFGSNIITKQKTDSFFKLFIESMSDPIIRILLIALGIKMVLMIDHNDWYETLGIVIAVFIASLISSLSEYGSEKAFIRLEEESSKIKCKVRRNGILKEIDISEVVIKDIVVLEAGDKIPADGRIIEGSITVDESSLTGETIEKEKNTSKDNKLFRATTVYSGNALMEVENVGDNTFYGRLALEIQEKKRDSPLKIRLRHLAVIISRIGYVSAFLVSFSFLFKIIVIDNGFNYLDIVNTISETKLMFSYLIHALTLAVTIIVVSVPEGLPMMVALVLSSNMKRMLKNNVLVRKLVGIETAGSINILFTDKTGTLTKGKLEVTSFVTGNGYIFDSIDKLKKTKIYDYVLDSILYNTLSSFDDNKSIIGGNLTERSLLSYIGFHKKEKQIKKFIPFKSETKYSCAILENDETYIKGAHEVLLDKCDNYMNVFNNLVKLNKEEIMSVIRERENRGERILTLAYSRDTNSKYMTLIGFLIIKDEVRNDVKKSINLVKDAGIQTIMITGDNVLTAKSIAKDVGIITSDDDVVLESKDLNKLSDEEVKKILPSLKVVARMLPQDKSRLISLSSELGLVVGMTGDGVNDAPALKKADVGFSMGSGTEVAKEASDIVILDNNFTSIVSSILFGRTIFKSIRKFIIFQLTVNMCAIVLSVIGPFIGISSPITVIQMLWINMVMDTLAGLAYAYEPPLIEYMKENPKNKNESILNKYMINEIFVMGIYISIILILFLKLPIIRELYRIDNQDKYLMTAFFGLFIFSAIFNSFNARTHRLNLIAHIRENRVFLLIILFIILVQLYLIYCGGSLFRTTGLTSIELYFMLIISFSVIPVDFIRKIILKFFNKKDGV